MADRRTAHDVRPAIEDTLGDGARIGYAETQLRDDGQLATFLPETDFTLLHELYRRVAGLCFAVMDGSTGGVRGALIPFVDAVTDVGRSIADARMTTKELEEARTTLEEARAKLEVALTDARRDADRRVEQERAESGAAIARLELHIVELETFATTAADPLIRRLTDYARNFTNRLTTAIRTVTTCRDQLFELQQQDVRVLADIEQVTVETNGDGGRRTIERTLDDEVAELSVSVAPFQREHLFLDEHERAQLAVILHRYDTVLELFRGLEAFLTTFEQERGVIDRSLLACSDEWTRLSHELRSATVLFPRLFDHDIFVLGGTTADIVRQQQRAYTSIQEVCRSRNGEITRMITQYRTRYEAIASALETMRERMDALRAFSDLAWFDALEPEDRAIIEAAVLTYRDTGKLSSQTLAGVLAHAGVFTDVGHPVDEAAVITRVERVLRQEFFAPAETNDEMQRKMRTFQLTTRGRYWREVWIRQHPAVAQRVRDGWAAWEQAGTEEQRQRRERHEERKRLRTERREAREREERNRVAVDAERRTQREQPMSIVGELQPLEQTVLVVLASLLPTLPPSRNQEQLVRCVAAAATAEIIPNTQPTHAARALRRIATFDPPLLQVTTGDHEARIALTPVALRAIAAIPSIPSQRIVRAQQMVTYRVKNWPTTRDVQFYHDLRGRLDLPLPIPGTEETPDDTQE